MIIIALLGSIILPIKDTDNPFEYRQKTFADVDLSPVLAIEKYLDHVSHLLFRSLSKKQVRSGPAGSLLFYRVQTIRL